MAGVPSSENVGNAFIQQYYTILRLSPEHSYRFYEDSSFVTWDTKDVVTTLEGINEMILSSDFRDSLVEVEHIQHQDSLQGSILVVVTGFATGKNDSKRKFTQTFLLLAKNKTSFFVLNDILRFVDDKEPKSPLVSDSEPARVSDDVSTQVESCVADDSIDYVKVTTEVVAETQPEQKASEVVSDIKDNDAPKSSYLEMLSKGKTSSAPAPATRFVRVSAFDGLSEQEKTKQTAARNGSLKAMALASTPKNVTKEEAPQTPSKSALLGPKGIYVGGLPPNTTVNDLVDAVKTFGRVKKDGVQVIWYEDQYCFGFVHFQSADSAKKAVEAQVITVKGKEAYISYKRSGRKTRAAADGTDNNRARSTSVRGKSHSRSPSRNGHSNNGVETRHFGANQQDNNDGGSGANQQDNNDGGRTSEEVGGEDNNGWSNVQRRNRKMRNGQEQNDQRRNSGELGGEDNGWTNVQRRNRKMRNGREQNDQRKGNGEAVQDQRSSTAKVAIGHK